MNLFLQTTCIQSSLENLDGIFMDLRRRSRVLGRGLEVQLGIMVRRIYMSKISDFFSRTRKYISYLGGKKVIDSIIGTQNLNLHDGHWRMDGSWLHDNMESFWKQKFICFLQNVVCYNLQNVQTDLCLTSFPSFDTISICNVSL